MDFASWNMTFENFASWKCPFRKLNLWFRSYRNCLSAWCSCLPMDITSLFQLWFAHCLKHWTPDFPSFEAIYSMYKMDPRKWSKMCPAAALLLNFFMLDSSLCFSSLDSWFGFSKGLQSSKAWILHVNELPFALPWIIQSSPSILDCIGDQKSIKNTKT